MSELYPLGPESVPQDLTQATRSYRANVWLACASLVLFIVLYAALTGWFGWTAYRLFSDAAAGGREAWMGYAAGAASAFLTLFLFKALFFVRRGGEADDVEVTAEQQPELFQFLHRLADEANAPRPHRVFFSPRVNAAVFYNLSLLSLFRPGRKNLEIGLGLVNALTLGELKAVLAHEFGHFAQRSMAVGRWVYIAQQVASQIVHERDVLDKFLRGLSRFDLRIAWVGWLLSLIVWALRAVLDTAFSLVIAAQRSLSREMEFNADSVSVSLTGSDALVHALHRLHAADDAWDRALALASSELAEGRAVSDIFILQKILTLKVKKVLGDELYDEPPPLPENDRPSHRVFGQETAHPPRMWATHPSNRAREDNAKQPYVEAPLDDRMAWALFRDARRIREEMTAAIIAGMAPPEALEGIEKVEMNQTLARVNQQFDRCALDPAYRGTYLGRSVVRDAAGADHLFGEPPSGDALTAALRALYPESLADDLERWRDLTEERDVLAAIRAGSMKTHDGLIVHRGEVLKRRQLRAAIEQMDGECEHARQTVHQHDERCRTAHRAAARALGGDWEAHLVGLVSLLHYADHTHADLEDAGGHFANVFSVVTADGRVSGRELKRLLRSGNEVADALAAAFEAREQVRLCPRVAAAMGIERWSDALPDALELPRPDKDNIDDWLGVVDGWLGAFTGAFDALRQATLEALLTTEGHVRHCFLEQVDPGGAPGPAAVPAEYATLVPGSERARQTRLGLWDRFQTADGLVAGSARFAVAGGLLGSLVWLSAVTAVVTVSVYNGLRRPVVVAIEDTRIVVNPMSSVQIDAPALEALPIHTTTVNGALLENLEVDASNSLSHYVYNVAGASPLVEWTATYGNREERPDRHLGAARWSTSTADYIFAEPPEQISTKSDGGTRDVLSAMGGGAPADELELVPDDQRDALIDTHARWDGPRSRYVVDWLVLAADRPGFEQVIAHRLSLDADEVIARRLEQNIAGDGLDALCERHHELAAASPDSGDWFYLAARCRTDSGERRRLYAEGRERFPDNAWLAFSAGYRKAAEADWPAAASAFRQAYEALPPFRDTIADPLARILRVTGEDSPEIMRRLADSSRYLGNVIALSEPNELENGYRAYSLLAAGDIEGAVDVAMTGPEPLVDVLRLAAASDGASPELVARAGALPADVGLDADSTWAAIGLALREGWEAQPIAERAQEATGDDPEPLFTFLQAILDDDLEAAQERALGLDPDARGHAYMAATIMLGARTPEVWRDEAKALLLPAERPYFQ